VPIQIWPLLPLDADPVLNTRTPETPLSPAFTVRIVISPLVNAVPSPDPMLMLPPEFVVLRPELSKMLPPAPLVPLPTESNKRPARPEVAAPEPSKTAPLLPLLALPDEKMSIPLTPADPAFKLRIVTMPLVVAVPSPLETSNDPPVLLVLRPAIVWSAPPAPLVPLPTEKRI